VRAVCHVLAIAMRTAIVLHGLGAVFSINVPIVRPLVTMQSSILVSLELDGMMREAHFTNSMRTVSSTLNSNEAWM
jgi:hypothetical protein